MKVLDLLCQQDHAFEGWFASEQDYLDQRQRGLLQCPLCGASEVRKTLSAPRINLGGRTDERTAPPAALSADPDPSPTPESPSAAQVQAAAWLQAARQFLAQAEDVGPRFAEEARRMHHGDAPERSIKVRASVAEAEQLREEGIPVLAVPQASTETLH